MRHVIIHYHVYKNAGSTINSILRKNFGAACGSVEGPNPWDTLEAQDILKYAIDNPGLKVISSHQASEVAGQIKAEQQPDSIIYVNVLEHIADDTTELSAIYQTLDSGGRVFVFVPALQWLYGSFDKQIGHFRRYQKSELESKCRHAGFLVVKSGYFDSIGIIPWWVKYCLFRSGAMEPGAVKFFDQWVVPLIRKVEHLIGPPIGKNIILIAEKV